MVYHNKQSLPKSTLKIAYFLDLYVGTLPTIGLLLPHLTLVTCSCYWKVSSIKLLQLLFPMFSEAPPLKSVSSYYNSFPPRDRTFRLWKKVSGTVTTLKMFSAFHSSWNTAKNQNSFSDPPNTLVLKKTNKWNHF